MYFLKIFWNLYLHFNMFHVFALTYYILLCCVMREYSMTSVTTKNYPIYTTREYTTTNDEKYSIYATHEYTTIFDLHDAYYSLLERYMKHVFVAGLLTGDFHLISFLWSIFFFVSIQVVWWNDANTSDLVITWYTKQKSPLNTLPNSKFKNRLWKKLGPNTFSFTHTVITLQY